MNGERPSGTGLSVDLNYEAWAVFLEHFDVLIYNAHGLLCLDDSAAMRAGVKGPHLALVIPAQTPDGAPLTRSPIIESRLSDAMRPVRLWLDSGTNVPFLYNPSEYLQRRTSQNPPQQGTGANRPAPTAESRFLRVCRRREGFAHLRI